MNELPAEFQRNLEEIDAAYRAAAGRWSGCNDETAFGKLRLNLQNLKAAQAHLLARATAGQEREDWQAAAEWLNQVERDARDAEEEARAAVNLARSGHFAEALRHARLACALEKLHHSDLVWRQLQQLIEHACASAEMTEAPSC